MQIPTKKLKTGFEIPVFGLGTWQMGGRFEYNETNNDEADIQAIKTAIDAGITHIDTAEIYADGHAETFVGKAIENYNRSKLFLVSKVGKDHLKYDDVISACRSSIERLGVEYLDLYLIHMINPGIPLQETMRAMDFLKENGLIKNIGVCNFTAERLEEAQSYTKNKIVYNQVHYNLIFREPERKNVLKYCQEHDIFLSAWRPLQKGELIDDASLVLQEMCEKYKKTPAQIAINWLISQPYVITLSKMGNQNHLEENLGAIGWEMEQEDIERIRKEFPNQKDISDAVSLG